jgi:translocator protein
MAMLRGDQLDVRDGVKTSQEYSPREITMISPGWRRQLAMLLFFLVICLGTAGAGAAVTAVSVSGWYQTLSKPTWTPPDWVFGPVWTTLYLLMAVAAWLVWRRAGWSTGRAALSLFALQLALNAAWSPLFFRLHSPGIALVDIIMLWVAIAATVWSFRRISALAGSLFVPYLLWVSYAMFLNWAIWRLNS